MGVEGSRALLRCQSACICLCPGHGTAVRFLVPVSTAASLRETMAGDGGAGILEVQE